MKNKEINLDDVITTLEKYNLSDLTTAFPKLAFNTLQHLTIDLLSSHWTSEYTKKFVSSVPMMKPGYNWLSDNLKTPIQTKITVVEFVQLYPTIYSKLIRSKDIQFNYKDYDKMYLYLFENRYAIKNRMQELGLGKAYYNCRAILNSLHGLLFIKKYCFLKSNMSEDLVQKWYESNVKTGIASGLIAANVDTMWFDLSNDIHLQVFSLYEDALRKNDLLYTIEVKTVDLSEERRWKHKWSKKKLILNDSLWLT